jgi:hypothetical protein
MGANSDFLSPSRGGLGRGWGEGKVLDLCIYAMLYAPCAMLFFDSLRREE